MRVCATVVCWQVLIFLFILPLSLPNFIHIPWPWLACLGHGRRAGRRGIKCLDMPSRCQVGQVKKHEAGRTLGASPTCRPNAALRLPHMGRQEGMTRPHVLSISLLLACSRELNPASQLDRGAE